MKVAFFVLLCCLLLATLTSFASPIHKKVAQDQMLNDEPARNDGEVSVRCTRTTCPWNLDDCVKFCTAFGFYTGSSTARDCTCHN